MEPRDYSDLFVDKHVDFQPPVDNMKATHRERRRTDSDNDTVMSGPAYAEAGVPINRSATAEAKKVCHQHSLAIQTSSNSFE